MKSAIVRIFRSWRKTISIPWMTCCSSSSLAGRNANLLPLIFSMPLPPKTWGIRLRTSSLRRRKMFRTVTMKNWRASTWPAPWTRANKSTLKSRLWTRKTCSAGPCVIGHACICYPCRRVALIRTWSLASPLIYCGSTCCRKKKPIPCGAFITLRRATASIRIWYSISWKSRNIRNCRRSESVTWRRWSDGWRTLPISSVMTKRGNWSWVMKPSIKP